MDILFKKKIRLINVTSKPYSFNDQTGISTKACMVVFGDDGSENVLTLKVNPQFAKDSGILKLKTFVDYDATFNLKLSEQYASVTLVGLKQL